MLNLRIEKNIRKKPLFYGFTCFLLLGLLLVSCQPSERFGTPTTVSDLTVTQESTAVQVTRTSRIITSGTVMPIGPVETNETETPSPTVTPRAVFEQTSTPLPSATPLPWQIADPNYFLLYEAGTSVRQPEIYMLRPEELTSRLVAYGDLIYGQPFSPDGMQIVFDNQTSSQESDSIGQFAIADLVTGEVLILDLIDPYPKIFWSPDGKYLLYEARQQQDNFAQIILYDLAASTNKVLLEVSDIFSLDGWSFDSQKIAFVSQMNGQHDLYTFDINTLNLEQLTDSPDIETAVIWSPTEMALIFGTSPYNEQLLWEGGPQYVNSLYLKDNADSNLSLLGNYDSLFRESLSWSPDGGKIAYSEGGNLCIRDIESDRTECPLEETEPFGIQYAAAEVPPSWSPDGHWLAFRASGSTQCPTVYFLEVQTGNVFSADLARCRTSPIYWSHPLTIGDS